MRELLLLFDESHPVWTKELVTLEGEDPENLEALRQRGLLEHCQHWYVLTPRGEEACKEEGGSVFLDITPGKPPANPETWLRRTELELRLNRAFQGRWGIKEFRSGTPLRYLTPLQEKHTWKEEKGQKHWIFDHDELFKELDRAWPLPLEIPEKIPSLETWGAWMNARSLNYSSLELDLLCLHHYDTAYFQHLPPQPNDMDKLFHTDRFYFHYAPLGDTLLRECWNILGQFHLFCLLQRRVFLPWYFDRDTTDYDAFNWWFWVTPKEDDIALVTETLKPQADLMAEPSMPFQIFCISLEALKKVEKKEEYHWDLFEKIAHPLSKAL